uniref:Uncharacterized protein n=1 Tax=Ditylenchus dipsaci TaxID=166011 RepID=A0A915DEJ6_9BILA
MLIEVEEAVCFLSVVSSRQDSTAFVRFSETRQLKIWKLVVNVAGDSDKMINEAAAAAQVDASKIRVLWPKHLILELQAGLIRAINAETKAIKQVYPSKQQLVSVAISERNDLRRVAFVNHIAEERCQQRGSQRKNSDCESVGLPLMETAPSSKLFKTSSSTPHSTSRPLVLDRLSLNLIRVMLWVFGHHPFTTPSVLAYSKLLQTLNKLASLPEDGGANEIPVLSNAGGAHP